MLFLPPQFNRGGGDLKRAINNILDLIELPSHFELLAVFVVVTADKGGGGGCASSNT